MNQKPSEGFWEFRPKLWELWRSYDRSKLWADSLAGLTVGVVALSLCIGLGIASGATPLAGLTTGVVAGFVISFFGGSRVQIGGPAGAFVGLVALVISRHGYDALLVCTMMAGVILLVMGFFKMGDLIRFVPQPVTAGFTCGIAITIALTQVRPALGLQLTGEPVEFLPRLLSLASAASSLQPVTVALTAAGLLFLWLWPRRWHARLPAPFVWIVASALVVSLFQLQVETVATRFGDIPRGLPHFAWPSCDWRLWDRLIADAFAIAILGGVESLLSAVVADGLIDDQHDSNQELKAQGLANLLSPLFGGLPATGVIARTATNIRSGAVSPVAGLVHALFLAAVLVALAPLAGTIPLPSLAAALLVVAWRMGEWDEFRELPRRPRSDSLVFITTFLLTVCFDLSVAVKVGMVLAAFLFVKRVADTTQVQEVKFGSASGAAIPADMPKGVLHYRVFGALLFGATEKLESVIRRSLVDTRGVILQLEDVTAMDATALERLRHLHAKLRGHGRFLLLCGPHTQPYFMMERAGFLAEVGEPNVVADLSAAVARARELLETQTGKR